MFPESPDGATPAGEGQPPKPQSFPGHPAHHALTPDAWHKKENKRLSQVFAVKRRVRMRSLLKEKKRVRPERLKLLNLKKRLKKLKQKRKLKQEKRICLIF